MAASRFPSTDTFRCSIPCIDEGATFEDTSPTYIHTVASQNHIYRQDADHNGNQYMRVIPKKHTIDDKTGVYILRIKQKTCVIELEYDPPTGILLPCEPALVFLNDSWTFVPYVIYKTSRLEVDLSYIPE